MDTTTRAGARRAAILLVALGGDLAAPLLRNLRDDQIEAITREIVLLEEVSERERGDVLAACAEGTTRRREQPTEAGEGFARELLARAVGTQRAADIVARVSPKDEPFGFVKQTDLAQIITYFESEHPQTVALALAHMPHHLAGQILGGLSPEVQSDVAQRIAQLARTDPNIIKGVEETMRRQLAHCAIEGGRALGGLDYLIGVLAATDTRTEQAIMEGIAESDPDLARELRQRMFTFEDVAALDDRSIQRLLREIDSRDLSIALRGGSEELRARVFRNMSTRASQALLEDIDRLGPVRLRIVEESQAKIVEVARRLQEAEEIVIPRGRQDVFI